MSASTAKPVTQTQTKKAVPWVVIFHDDNHTTFDCVFDILTKIFGKSHKAAYQLTLTVHNDGLAVVAKTTQEIAETLKSEAISYARQQKCPLKVTTERNN